MKKISLLTPFDTGNIGTVLQAFATQTLIQERNCTCELLYYHYESIQNPFLLSNLFKRGMKKYLGSIAGYFMRFPAKRGLWNFINKHLKITEKVTYSDLKNIVKKSDKIMVGSDCVWNCDAFSLDTAYLLDFTDDNDKKINYASSFACDDIPEDHKAVFSENLSKFETLSVREIRGRELIKELTGKDATVVLDPTLAKDSYFWSKIASESKIKFSGDYVFVAEYAISPALINDAEKLSKQYGLPIYCLYPPKGKSIHAKIFLKASPQDVLYLIQNAKFILTDSYHMMIFSINFGKDFFAYQTPTNLPAISKYYSILQLLNLEERLFKTEGKSKNDINITGMSSIPYADVFQLLALEREKSHAYLDMILNR